MEKEKKYGNWKRHNSTEALKECKNSIQNSKRVISSATEKNQNECAIDL